MHIVVFEDAGFRNLLPLVYSRASFNLRCGFDNLLAKIESAHDRIADAVFVRPGLAAVMAERQRERHPTPRLVNQVPTGDDQLWVNGRLLVRCALELPPMSAAFQGDALLAARIDRHTAAMLSGDALLDPARVRTALAGLTSCEVSPDAAARIEYPWHLVRDNAAEIIRQFFSSPPQRLGRVWPGAHLIDESAIHVGAGSVVRPGAVLDAEPGPIHVGENVVIHSNATIHGPCYIGDGSVVNPGAYLHGGCGIGPVCKIGGELDAVIVHGYSNKQHDGFLGHSYVGEWVNLGADTVNSDLKNTYGPVAVALNGLPINTGETFVGAFIGDHTKSGINVALPTGCVIGHACSVFTSRHVPRFVPSFSWLTDDGLTRNDPSRALAVARKVVARRNRSLSPAEEALFLSIADEARRIERSP